MALNGIEDKVNTSLLFDESLPLLLYINGKEKKIVSPNPSMTLLTYLRTVELLTATKLGCGEGGCGACTVMLSRYDKLTNEVKHCSANACLTPLCSLDGCAVTTVEGIGGMREGLHPVQKRIAQFHGSQCGFCTPGIVMSIYSQLRSFPNSTPHQLEDCLDGNLCRCTGNRSILDAAKSLSNQKNGGCCMGNSDNSGGCPCRDNVTDDDYYNDTSKAVHTHESLQEESHRQGLTEPIFPSYLLRYEVNQVKFNSNKIHWYQPTSFASLLQLKSMYPEARLIVGNTEVGIETKFKGMEFAVMINPNMVPEIKSISIDKDNTGITVGGCVTINDFRSYILKLKCGKLLDGSRIRSFVAIEHMLTWFASNQIRNVACIAGNIVTASPISDLNPMLMACRAMLKVTSIDGSRIIPINDFFIAYRKVDLKSNEILESVSIPFSSAYEFVVPLKQARRREDDISIVTSGIRIKLRAKEDLNQWIVEDFVAAFGGMAPRTVHTPKTAATIIGKPWSYSTFDEAYTAIKKELYLPDNVPGGQAEYRLALSVSFLFKAFLAINNDLRLQIANTDSADGVLPPAIVIDDRIASGAGNFITSPKPESRGEQVYKVSKGGMTSNTPSDLTPVASDTRGIVGSNIMHKSAISQVSGDALYTGDIPLSTTTVHAALVTSTRAHAKILGIDPKLAEVCEGFVAFFSSKDVTGSNHIGAILKDEEVFCTEYVKHYGAVIGVVIANTHEQALYAAKNVIITYEELPTVVSIEEAIAANSFFPSVHDILDGDLDKEEAESNVVVSGRVRIGGQEHFYLETNCTVAIPKEYGQLEIYSSTQNPTKTQNFCAAVCGLPASKVVAKCKRMGGGFGGKETRSVFIAVTAALAAHLLSRPVSISIEREQDMSITGQRHAFIIDYRAGCDNDGKLKFLDLHLFSNAGFSMDLSQPIMDRALLHCDNVYKWPALRAKGTLCKTNQPTHTAFRGFGGPQGMIVTEQVLTHLASELRVSPSYLREKNFYKNGDTTHFRQELEGFYVPTLWEELKHIASFDDRCAAVANYNSNNKYRKKGISLMATKFGINFTAKFMNQGGALVHIYTDGTVLVSIGGTEMGQGLFTKVIQIAAQCFNISDTSVHISETSTNTVANTSPTAASMSTDLYGMAVQNACEEILERLAPLRKELPADTTWANLITAAFFQRIDLTAHGYYAIANDRCGYDFDKSYDHRGFPFNYFTQGVVCTEVEIDTLTGNSIVNRVDILMDVGKSINPTLDIGQIEGAFMQGYGWSSMEELVWGDTQHQWVKPGQLFTRGPGTYKIPSFNDVPLDFRIHLSDTHNKYAIHSSKAIGEPPFFLGASAFFAIQHAVNYARAENVNSESSSSIYLLDHPATSERIRMGCLDQLILDTVKDVAFKPKGSW